MAPPESRTIAVRSSLWPVYAAVSVVLLLTTVGSLAVRPDSLWGWVLVLGQFVLAASFAAQAAAAAHAAITVTAEGIAWKGRRGLLRYQAAWDDIAGFNLTTGTRVLPCVELKEEGPLPLVVYGMTAGRSKALIDELEAERQARMRPAPSGPKPKASGTARPAKRKKR